MTRLEERLAARVDELNSEMHAVEKRLTDDQGTTVRKPIVYPRGHDVLVAEGETIDKKHLRRFKELVQAEVSELEKNPPIRVVMSFGAPKPVTISVALHAVAMVLSAR